jgi:ATP-dependent Clp protease protease subunit
VRYDEWKARGFLEATEGKVIDYHFIQKKINELNCKYRIREVAFDPWGGKLLAAGSGDIDVWIHSPGGDVFAAAEIYTALKEYPGKVVVKISALAASAASVIAMAGDEILMAPVACMMIHNPCTVAIGDSEEMRRAQEMLLAVKETIITAYALKSGQSRDAISQMMDAESWLFAQDAIRLGFADGTLYDSEAPIMPAENLVFTRQAVAASLLNRLPPRVHITTAQRDNIITKQIQGDF